ncbi:MAG: rhodanese-like domain-containing protein [Chromatiales bacterium]|nr:rhodanese-like domain-containing protein [Chromatiales bacterium]
MLNLKKEWIIKSIILGAAVSFMAGCATVESKPKEKLAQFNQKSLEALGSNDAKIKVKITPKLSSINIAGYAVKRNQNQKNTINPSFKKTSRKCPPFCIRPWIAAPGVETVAELEVLYYAKLAGDGDKSILIVDARTPDWAQRGTIPTSINVPFTKLVASKGANDVTIADALEKFGAVEKDDGSWDFSKAKTLVQFCNGMWCGQSPLAIKALVKLGYPANKLKYYRGGMQSWETLGLPTVKP